MAISDEKLISLLLGDESTIRNAALDLLSSSFVTERSVLLNVFDAWDRFGVESAFSEFPMITHLSVSHDLVEPSIDRARTMSSDRPLTDRQCRCAGKLIEAISVASPVVFQDHIDKLVDLKSTSKIFFRVDTDRMAARCGLLLSSTSELIRTVESGAEEELHDALESLLTRGEAEDFVIQGLTDGANLISRTSLLDACLRLATRYPLYSNEARLSQLIDHQVSTVADAATLGLSHLRNNSSLSFIANKFPEFSRQGQLRSIDFIRRTRLEKSAELLRFLRAYAKDGAVQEALRVAEILQFDFESFEDWLEAIVIISDPSLARISNLLQIAKPMSKDLSVDDSARMRELVRSRVKNFDEQIDG